MRPSPSAVVLLVVSLAAAAGSCRAAPEADHVASANARTVSATTGRIRGMVHLRGDPPVPAFQPISKDRDICGREVPVTRISLGPGGGVRHAFVYLENAPASEPLRARETVPVEQSRCEYFPHAIQIPAGTRLDIANGDPILHNVHARQMTADGLQTIFNIAQPMQGQRTVVDLPLTRPGIVALTCEAGHPWMTAYILVADHPYTAVTGDEGNFVIEGVPAGTYRIRMWHEGVRLTNVLASLQRYEYEPPYELTREVVVPAAGEVEVNFDIELREPAPSAS